MFSYYYLFRFVVIVVVVVVSGKIAANVFGLGEGGDFNHKTTFEAQNIKFTKNCHTKR